MLGTCFLLQQCVKVGKVIHQREIGFGPQGANLSCFPLLVCTDPPAPPGGGGEGGFHGSKENCALHYEFMCDSLEDSAFCKKEEEED